MTQTILNGSDRKTQDAYIGADKEITVDTSDRELRLHDGVTPGGKRLTNLDSLLELFQRRSAELDGFNFAENAAGFLLRLGAANYSFRIIGGTDGQITVTNGNGRDGNPTLSLPDSITKAIKFAQGITFADDYILEVSTAGDHTGDVHGDLLGDSTGKHTGSVDVRGQTLQLDDKQIPFEAIDGLDDALGGLAFPHGMIVMWGGTVDSIPAGWALCDGTNGRPDLRNRFVYGAGAGDGFAAPGAVGGTTTHKHIITVDASGDHTHVVNVANHVLTVDEIPTHNHRNGVTDSSNSSRLFNYGTAPAEAGTPDSIDNNSNNGNYQGLTSSTGGGAAHGHGGSSESAGNHTHAVNEDVQTHIPPYFALAYIIKL